MMYEEELNEGKSMQESMESRSGRSQRDEVYSLRVPAGKRTYFFDVKTTRSGKDFFITITESKRVGENRYEKHKIFLYKEDFGKFVNALNEVINYIREECLPDYEFRDLPEATASATEAHETETFSEEHEEEHLEEEGEDTASDILSELDSLGEFSEEPEDEERGEA